MRIDHGLLMSKLAADVQLPDGSSVSFDTYLKQLTGIQGNLDNVAQDRELQARYPARQSTQALGGLINRPGRVGIQLPSRDNVRRGAEALNTPGLSPEAAKREWENYRTSLLAYSKRRENALGAAQQEASLKGRGLAFAGANPNLAAGVGGVGLGAAAGLAGTALFGDRDEEGRKHWLRNMLLSAIAGGAIGYAGNKWVRPAIAGMGKAKA